MTYFSTYTDAVQHALQTKRDEGFVFEEDVLFILIGVNSTKPSEGKTTSLHLPIVNSEMFLHIQVFNRGYEYGNCYELNFYAS